MAQQIIVSSQPLPATALSEALRSLFMAAMEFYSEHREVDMPEMIRNTLKAMHHAMQNPEKPQIPMLILGVSVIAKKGGALNIDRNVAAALALARTVLMAAGA